MPSPLDSVLCKQLGKYVETLTHTGQKILDKEVLKKLKNVCRKSDGYVEHTYHLLIYQLEKTHAEIRYSAFQICDELFRRSHCFRELLVSNMQHVMELTCETSNNPLPPPRSVALSLKRLALQTIQEWSKEYGDGYKKLHLGYNFLKHCKKVDFNTLQVENSAERARQQEQERRQNFINEEKLKSITVEINEMQPEITHTLTALENCIALLFPTPEDFFIQDADNDETKSKIPNSKSNAVQSVDSAHERAKKEECNMDQKTTISGQNENNIKSENIKDDKQESTAQSPSKSEEEEAVLKKYKEIVKEAKEDSDKTSTSIIKDNRRSESNETIVEQDPNVPATNTPEEENGDYMEVETSDSETDVSDTEEGIDFREYGIVNPKYSIEVNVKTDSAPVKETDENAAIFENAKDMYILINNRYLPAIKKWIRTLTKISATGQSDLLKKMIHLKQSLEKATKKYVQLKEHAMANCSSDSSDSDFEEVKEKEGYEENVREEVPMPGPSGETVFGRKKLKKTSTLPSWNICSEENNEKDPTSAYATLSTLMPAKSSAVISPSKKGANNTSSQKNKDGGNKSLCNKDIEPVPSTSKDTSSSTLEENTKAKLLAVAPKVPFDIDLYHWEDDRVGIPTMVAVRAEGSRFWCSAQEELEEVPVPDGLSSLRTRVIEFTGKFEPVRWSCRALLPSGKLCPRKDRHKCPFHGPIVPRDETGKCSRPEDAERLCKQEEEKQQECPDWQDPQLLEDIKKATGVDLKMPEKNKSKRGKKKKKSDKDKYPGLTDINARQNTAYTRLSKKIFKRGTMKRVARAMDAMDHKRFRDKYGDQFHYMHDTS